MSRGDRSPRRRAVAVATIVATALLAADLTSKAWAVDALRMGKRATPLPGLLHFELSLNRGSALGLFGHGPWADPVLVIVPLIAVVLMGWLALRAAPTRCSVFVAAGLVAGGALGNLHDRLFREVMTVSGSQRGVVDFIVVFVAPDHRWPAFNLADLGLVLGTGVLVLLLSRHGLRGLRDPSTPRPG